MLQPRMFPLLFIAAVACTENAPSLGERSAESRHCDPDGDCGPPPAPDPEDPPPEDPPQPDPAKFRERVIPTSWVKTKLAPVAGTKIQVSHLGGDTLSWPRESEQCHTDPNPDAAECRADCLQLDDAQQRTQCLAHCPTAGGETHCEDVCTSTESKSYVRWSNVLVAGSGSQACNAETCPACASPSTAPKLASRGFAVPWFEGSYTVGPFTYEVECKLDRWVFQVDATSINSLVIGPSGASVRVAGYTASPSIVCDNLPDVSASNIFAELEFSFATTGIAISANATLHADWSFGGVTLPGLGGFIADKVRDGTHGPLNTPAARETYHNLFTGLVASYVESTGEHLDILGNITAEAGGLRVRYWVQ